HLFVQEVGLAFRPYVLWLRLNRAVEAFAAGEALTAAAYQAGFSDSAHLSRTFRRMYGIAAASLQLE
ncbi:MAG: helix-turn-helix domain-containing protein, partial [Gemmatimonadales bacterium]|nr:helix-turn-helix domain-containing protein [Gemmatimonadales bacterium]